MKICPLGAKLFQARTDMTKPLVAFRNFAKVLENEMRDVHADVTIRSSLNHDMEIAGITKKVVYRELYEHISSDVGFSGY
jgi:hypothetical protein